MIAKRSRRRINRNGLATIEVALCLLILSVALSTMFVVFSYVHTASGLAVAARYNAWHARHDPWRPQQDSSLATIHGVYDKEFERILGSAPLLEPINAIFAETEKEVTILATESTIGTDHYVFGGTWAHEEIEFEHHSPLTHSRMFPLFLDPLRGGSFMSAIEDASMPIDTQDGDDNAFDENNDSDEDQQSEDDEEEAPENETRTYNVYVIGDTAGIGVAPWLGVSVVNQRIYIQDPETGQVWVFRNRGIGPAAGAGGGVMYSEQLGTLTVQGEFNPSDFEGFSSSMGSSVVIGVGGTFSVDENGNQVGGYAAGGYVGASVEQTYSNATYVGTASSLEEAGYSSIWLQDQAPFPANAPVMAPDFPH